MPGILRSQQPKKLCRLSLPPARGGHRGMQNAHIVEEFHDDEQTRLPIYFTDGRFMLMPPRHYFGPMRLAMPRRAECFRPLAQEDAMPSRAHAAACAPAKVRFSVTPRYAFATARHFYRPHTRCGKRPAKYSSINSAATGEHGSREPSRGHMATMSARAVAFDICRWRLPRHAKRRRISTA